MLTRPQPDTGQTARVVLRARRELRAIEQDDPARSGRIRLQLISLQRRFRAGVINEDQFAHFVTALGLNPTATI